MVVLSIAPCYILLFSLMLSLTMSKRRIVYCILEYFPLLDSSNMSMKDWARIATDIRRHYEIYDAFIVLHGTDTMAYTASALSFMLQNLGKSVILTGSQVCAPICVFVFVVLLGDSVLLHAGNCFHFVVENTFLLP